jgi:tRNA (guanine37-N1)-methyltransferase
MLNIKIITLFPELYPGPLSSSVLGRALKKSIWKLSIFNLRDFAVDKHKTVDDTPYGGGSGMVIKADILGNAIEDVTNNQADDYLILYPTPRGELLKQKKIVEFVNKTNILIICGRYEGIDQRVIEKYDITEFSIGDYVLSGGEIASYVLIDAMVRVIPEVLGNSLSLQEESFAVNTEFSSLLEYPHYTRPLIWKNRKVPEVLSSGNHEKIAKWRLDKAKELTKSRRSDLWFNYKNNK